MKIFVFSCRKILELCFNILVVIFIINYFIVKYFLFKFKIDLMVYWLFSFFIFYLWLLVFLDIFRYF